MRIVAGEFRGRKIVAPDDDVIRPTSDRVRESVFNILSSGIEDFDLHGANVLDLFSGTGALGLEAVSRGAGFCLFVEQDATARGIVRQNIEAFGLTGKTKLHRRSAVDLGDVGNREPFDIVFADPPYGQSLGEAALLSAAEGGWLKIGAIAVLEEAARSQIALPTDFKVLDERRYGDTQIIFGRYQAD